MARQLVSYTNNQRLKIRWMHFVKSGFFKNGIHVIINLLHFFHVIFYIINIEILCLILTSTLSKLFPSSRLPENISIWIMTTYYSFTSPPRAVPRPETLQWCDHTSRPSGSGVLLDWMPCGHPGKFRRREVGGWVTWVTWGAYGPTGVIWGWHGWTISMTAFKKV